MEAAEGRKEGKTWSTHLIAAPRRLHFVHAATLTQREVVDVTTVGSRRPSARAHGRAVEHSGAIHDRVLILWTDFIHVGFLEEVQEAMAIEVDPDERSCDAAFVT